LVRHPLTPLLRPADAVRQVVWAGVSSLRGSIQSRTTTSVHPVTTGSTSGQIAFQDTESRAEISANSRASSERSAVHLQLPVRGHTSSAMMPACSIGLPVANTGAPINVANSAPASETEKSEMGSPDFRMDDTRGQLDTAACPVRRTGVYSDACVPAGSDAAQQVAPVAPVTQEQDADAEASQLEFDVSQAEAAERASVCAPGFCQEQHNVGGGAPVVVTGRAGPQAEAEITRQSTELQSLDDLLGPNVEDQRGDAKSTTLPKFCPSGGAAFNCMRQVERCCAGEVCAPTV
jgi:hypothetical protein